LSACNSAGDVLTTQTPGDAGRPAEDAAGAGDANVADASELADAGAKDAESTDAVVPPPPPTAWERLPGLYGAWFRFAGNTGTTPYFLGRRFDESNPRVYRLHSDNGGHDRLAHPTDDRGSPLFPPIGPIAELDSRILWATESDGIVASEDSGQSWSFLNLPWQDGSVGDGNGHVSRILKSWTTGDSFCLHREVTPWVEYHVQDENRYNEVRCLTNDAWSTVTASIAEGVRFFNAYGDDLYGHTAPLYNQATGAPKFCHSDNLGVNWDCFDFALTGFQFYRTASGRLVMPEYVDTSSVTHTQIWYSDDHGENWEHALTVENVLTDISVIGEKVYGLSLFLDVASEVYVMDLDARSVELLPAPTKAHIQWIDMLDFHGELHVADSRGLRRYDVTADRWFEVEVEPLPALRVTADPSGNIWTIDGTRTARRLADQANVWDEVFFDDSGWGSGDVLDHAVCYDLTKIDGTMFFGAAHRKLFQVDTSVSPFVVSEDDRLTVVIDPDASLVVMTNAEGWLYAAATGGEHVNHGNGNRTPWGGGVYRRDTDGNWADVGQTLPTRTVGNILGYGIVSALYANTGILVAATHDGVYRSVNQGAAWSPVSGIFDYDAAELPTNIAGHGQKVLLSIAEDLLHRIYFSENNGLNFRELEDNLPIGELRDLAVQDGVFYALLDPLGVFQSIDDGLTWMKVGQTDPLFPTRTFKMDVDDTQILVGTSDGVWRVTR
jgi:hypothetical protein